MTKVASSNQVAGVSSAAVQARTGKTWPQWLKVLDAAGARKMDHKQIVAWLKTHHRQMGGWWIQMVTVGYEQARGLRQKHEKPSGFEISRSRTIAVNVSTLYRAWQDARTRRRWLNDAALTIRKATPGKSLRISWDEGASSVNVNFYSKGTGKSQVTVQHGKLRSAREATSRKKYWGEQLDRLQQVLEA